MRQENISNFSSSSSCSSFLFLRFLERISLLYSRKFFIILSSWNLFSRGVLSIVHLETPVHGRSNFSSSRLAHSTPDSDFHKSILVFIALYDYSNHSWLLIPPPSPVATTADPDGRERNGLYFVDLFFFRIGVYLSFPREINKFVCREEKLFFRTAPEHKQLAHTLFLSFFFSAEEIKVLASESSFDFTLA